VVTAQAFLAAQAEPERIAGEWAALIDPPPPPSAAVPAAGEARPVRQAVRPVDAEPRVLPRINPRDP